MTKRELLIGCGSNKTKRLVGPNGKEWSNLTTLDFVADHNPDVVHDLMILPLPFEDESFDEIHAYDVLEHTGTLGDFRWFFAQWSDFYRLLRPNGLFFCISPDASSRWAFADPGHTRVLAPEMLVFLDQKQYKDQVGKTPMSDYRPWFSGDFITEYADVSPEGQLAFVIRAIKPSRR